MSRLRKLPAREEDIVQSGGVFGLTYGLIHTGGGMVIGQEAHINVDGREVIFLVEDSISKGTLDEGMLIAEIESWLESVDPTGYKKAMERKEQYYVEEEDGETYVLIAEWWNEGLFHIMCDYAPKGYYFGGHPGSSADVGFWKITEVDDLN